MAENCPISSLNISFCYKVMAQQLEIIVSMLRAKGTLQSFEAIGVTLSPIGVELLTSTLSLTKLSLCGIALINDDIVDLVSNSSVHKNAPECRERKCTVWLWSETCF